VSTRQEWLLPPRRIEISKFGEWAEKNLCESEAVVIETTTNVRDIYDIVQPRAGHAMVAVWHVLSKEETDVRASEEDLASKMLLWSWSLSAETRQGLTY
jgi:hypothetical protein